jgi:hypothetical protein
VKFTSCNEVSLSKYIIVKYFLPSNSPKIIIFLCLFLPLWVIYYTLKEVTKRSSEMSLVIEEHIITWWTLCQESGWIPQSCKLWPSTASLLHAQLEGVLSYSYQFAYRTRNVMWCTQHGFMNSTQTCEKMLCSGRTGIEMFQMTKCVIGELCLSP